MPPDFDEDLEAQLDAALKAPRASGAQRPAENLIAVPAPDSGATDDFDSDLESQLDAALSKPHDITAGVRNQLAQPTGSGTSDDPVITHPDKVNELPVQSIVGDVPKPTEKAWYERFLPAGRAAVAGAAQGATMNFGDEGAAALTTAASKLLQDDDTGIPREYAAGSQYADTQQVMDADNKRQQAAHPVAYVGGQILGAAPAAIATAAPIASAVNPVLATGLGVSAKALPYAEAAAGAAGMGTIAGAGAAKPGERLEGAAVGGAEGAVAGPLLHGTASVLGTAAKSLKNTSNNLLTQTFMTPAQRHKFQLAKGPGSLDKLGQDAWDTGLFGGSLRRLLPNRARGVASRAVENMETSGADIGKFENGLVEQGVNPDVNIKPIVDDLRGAASDLNVPALKSGEVVDTINRGADLLEQPESVSVAGKMEKPPALPEWSLNKPQAPKYGAAVEPVQESLPGTEFQHAAADRPLPPPVEPEQMTLPTPRKMPDKQLGLDLTPEPPVRPEPTQYEMSLPRQQPTQQLGLGLEPQQGKLRLPPLEAPKNSAMPLNKPAASPEDILLASLRELSGGQSQRVKLADLQAHSGLDKSTFDQASKNLTQRGHGVMYRIDDTNSLNAADHASAIDIAGNPRHVMYPTPEGLAASAPKTAPQQVLSGGAAQEPLFGSIDPARPQAPAIQPEPAAPPKQLGMNLPHRQVPFDLDMSSRPNRFAPAERPAQQMNLPVQQELPLPGTAPRENPVPTPEPTAANPLSGKQEALGPTDVMNPNRGPQPELSTQLPAADAQIARETLPFTQAMKLKRFLGDEINWSQNPNRPGTRAEEITNKTSWKGLTDQIDTALQGDERVDPAAFAKYGQDKKKFSTAATAFDPALRMAEREGEMGLGARDMLAGAALGGGPIGGVAAVANKTLAGSLPSAGAVGLRALARAARGGAATLKGAAKVSPVTFARQQNPEASEAEIKRKANEQVKQDLQKYLEQP